MSNKDANVLKSLNSMQSAPIALAATDEVKAKDPLEIYKTVNEVVILAQAPKISLNEESLSVKRNILFYYLLDLKASSLAIGQKAYNALDSNLAKQK
ncbi:hypothetical protein V496_00019 [Pseudogymnoascus sp. VKM F-4515 (FW-2607)]|nr:hypothetical protein V496_00019 [Pseudogymnoascus sp. VKM F-4515 (FW-2607)]